MASDQLFFSSNQWTPEQIKQLKEQRILSAKVSGVTQFGMTQFGVREGGFCFVYANWGLALKERDYYRSDAQAHYLEALRRQAVCRLDGNDTEAAWYKEFATWFEIKFGCKAATEQELSDE